MTPLDIMMMGRRGGPKLVTFVNSFLGQLDANTSPFPISVSGISSGDFLLAIMGTNAGDITWSGDTGWVEDADEAASPNLRVAHLASATAGTTSYSFTLSQQRQAGGAILQFRNTQFDVIGSIVKGSSGGAGLSVPAITPAAGATPILVALNASANTAFNNITGWTEIAVDATDGKGPSFRVWTRDALADGSSSVGATAVTTGSTTSAAVLLSIKPT
jgi:hypothetical protein